VSESAAARRALAPEALAKGARSVRRAYALFLVLSLGFAAWKLETARDGLRIVTTRHLTDAGRQSLLSIGPDRGDSAGGGPAVLLVHGEPGSKEVFMGLALALARAGLTAHLVDLPGSGQAAGPGTEEAQARALRAAFEIVARDPRTSNRRVLLVGQGAGASAALTVASETRTEGVIAMAPLLRAATLPKATRLVLVLGERQPRRLRNESLAAARASAGSALDPPIVVPNTGTLTLPLSPVAVGQVVDRAGSILGAHPTDAEPPSRNVWIALYVTCGFLLFPPTMSFLGWLKGEAPDVFLATPTRPGLHLGIAALAASAAPLVLNFGVPLGFLHLAGGDVVASMALTCAILRGLLLLGARVNLHMPPVRPLASSVLLGLFPFAYVYGLVGSVVSRELFYVLLDGPRMLRASSIFVFVLPFFLLEEAAFSPLVRKLGAPVGFLLGIPSKLFFVWAVWAVAASSLVPALPGPRLLLTTSLPLLTAALLSVQMFATFVSKSTENATMAASFGALSFSWLLAVFYPLV